MLIFARRHGPTQGLVTSLDAGAESVAGSGAGVLWDDDFPGHRRFYVNDCFGNRLEFLEPLPR